MDLLSKNRSHKLNTKKQLTDTFGGAYFGMFTG